jgi:hypothetical protein
MNKAKMTKRNPKQLTNKLTTGIKIAVQAWINFHLNNYFLYGMNACYSAINLFSGSPLMKILTKRTE